MPRFHITTPSSSTISQDVGSKREVIPSLGRSVLRTPRAEDPQHRELMPVIVSMICRRDNQARMILSS